jgi:microcystin degradation protein MlrC
MLRIALGSILTECNELGGMLIDITWFERCDLHRDAFTTGVRGVRLLLDAREGRCRPSMAIAKAMFILDTPGPTPPTVRHVQYKNVRRPYFPLDKEIPGLTPTILR